MDNTNAAEISKIEELIRKYSPFFKEIRKRFFFTAILFFIFTFLGFLLYEHIIKIIIDLLNLRGVNLVFTTPFQFINLAASCGIAVGIVLVFPILVYQILSFLKPALQRKELRVITRLLPFSVLLFISGFTFGVVVMKWQIQLLLEKSVSLGIGNVLDITNLIGTVLLVSSVMGIVFQFPIVILLLTRIGLVKNSHLTEHRTLVYLGALFFAILLPLDSILADAMLTLPIIIMYEITLLLNRYYEKKKSL